MLTLHTGFPFGNPLFYSRNKYKEKGQRSPKGELALAVAGSLHAAPSAVLAPSVHMQTDSYFISKGFNLLLQPWLSGASAALPASLPTAPLSGAGLEHSPCCWGTLQLQLQLQLPAQHHPFPLYTAPTFSRKSQEAQINLIFSYPQLISVVFLNFSMPGNFKMQMKSSTVKIPGNQTLFTAFSQ